MHETHVVTFEVSANAAGERLFVTGATITLGVNDIPQIELQCTPTNKGSPTPLKPNVFKPSISDFSDLYNKLAEKAPGLRETGNVHIVIHDNHGYSDVLDLNGWILAGVGLSSVSATSAPYLSVILQHPICKLTKVGSIYETPKSLIDRELNKATKGCSNFLEVVTQAYRCVRNLVEYWPPPNAYPPVLRGNLGVGEYDPNRYLVFKGGNGIFLGGIGGTSKERMAQAMARIAVPRSDGSSTWDMFVGAAGKILMSITQDQGNNYTTQQLVLEPTQPWKVKTITLYDDRCFWTDMPNMDSMKLYGVMARKLGSYSDWVNLGFLRNGNPNVMPPVSEVMYMPLPTVTISDGRIMKTPVPELLDSGFRRDAPYGGDIANASIKMGEARQNLYNTCVGRYCKAVYEITAASMVQMKAQMALGFRDKDGALIVPGSSCNFVSEGKDIYYGYIRKVVHTLSTKGGNATTVFMAYGRPEPPYKLDGVPVIPYGAKNPAYD